MHTWDFLNIYYEDIPVHTHSLTPTFSPGSAVVVSCTGGASGASWWILEKIKKNQLKFISLQNFSKYRNISSNSLIKKKGKEKENNQHFKV